MNTPDNLPRYRRVFFKLTNTEFQISFLVFTFMIGFIATLISMVGFMFVISSFGSAISQVKDLDWTQIEELLRTRVNSAWQFMVTLFVINIVTLALISFAFSHRVSGILFRINKTLRQLDAGEQVSEIRPRKGDFFGDLVETVNQMIRSRSGR